MTQAKKTDVRGSEKKAKAPKIHQNLNRKFLELSPVMQQGVTNFFNAHNIAHYIYENLSEDAQAYVSYCIRLSQNADKIEIEEQKQSAQP